MKAVVRVAKLGISHYFEANKNGLCEAVNRGGKLKNEENFLKEKPM